MNIQIYAKSVDLTNGLREAVYDSFNKLENYMTGTFSVTLDVRHGDHVADAIVHVPGHNDVYASSSTKDMYKSIEEVSDKIETQLKKYQDKNKNIDRTEFKELDEE